MADRPAQLSTPLSLAIVRPLNGVDAATETCLRSTFQLDQKDLKIYFCVANADDPVIPLVRALIDQHPHCDATLLVGNERISENPKLNNLVKAWPGIKTDWIIFVDANVILPADAIARLLAADGPDVGLISSPPRGVAPNGPAAMVECAILNSYQGRWQSFADAAGYGFAQGKVLAFRRQMLERAGGLQALAREPAEDAAATKLVRSLGMRVRLVDCFFDQPVGPRTWREIWQRQTRWASLRRASFPVQFAAELLSFPWLAAMLAALSTDTATGGAAAASAILCVWYGAESLCGRAAGWPEMTRHRVLRDLMMPMAWCSGWVRTNFEWHGHKMRAERSPTTSAA